MIPKKHLCEESRELLASLITYFERERDNGGSLLPISSPRDRVAEATGISITTLNRIAVKRGQPNAYARKPRKRPKPVVDVDDFDKNAIRNVIYNMYRDSSRSSLYRLLKNLGFTYKKDDPRRGLMELPHIVAKRARFLHDYVKMKREGFFQFVYLDETWIFNDSTIGRSWQDADVRSVKKLRVGNTRFIVLHAGSSSGFIPGAELVFSSKMRDSDYHGEMNRENFLKWFEHQLLMNLEQPSAIIMDNASYHSTVRNKAPTMADKKADMQKWLTENGIAFEPTYLKTQLFHLIQMRKPPPVYEAETLAEQYGHTVLRLPPYHCMFNPIENIWGITKATKNYYNDHVGSKGSSTEAALGTWREALQKATPEVWANTIEKAEKLIQEAWDREVMFDWKELDPIIIHLGSDSDDSDDSMVE